MAPEYGETWTYESIVGALPGVDVQPRAALAVQFVGFEAALLSLAAVYDLWSAAIAGTVAVLVATVGSAAMLRISRLVRGEAVPDAYRRLLFGSSIEMVLTVVAYVALITYLFAVDPRRGSTALLTRLLGPAPPPLAVAFTLLVLWDVCYRIGTAWWACVAAVWRSSRYRFDRETASVLGRADLETLAFGLLQLALVPFLTADPLLFVAVVGHVGAVAVVTGTSLALLWRRAETETATPI